ncbi:dTMP kinase [Chromatiales bacterium (ex Bugula neritina AB1)]|nr:dTMP kinase [Chromatiales bacterium (ex Bugula neritina AB1)]
MADKQRGRFITLEGAEGVGKSTLLPVVRDVLQRYGFEVVCTREPGGTPLGEQLREVVLGTEDPMVAKAELLLMFASRAQHIESIIEPALSSGVWVLCDRFTDASYAYQGAGRQLGMQRVSIIEAWVQEGLQPDLTLLLDASRETSLARTRRRRSLDRIETEGDTFFERVRQGYLERARENPSRIQVIDANPDFESVSVAAESVLCRVIDQWADVLVSTVDD